MGVGIINKEGGKWKGSYNKREWKKWWAREYEIKSERVLVIPVSHCQPYLTLLSAVHHDKWQHKGHHDKWQHEKKNLIHDLWDTKDEKQEYLQK